jgi:subtilisin family serine protease
LCKNYTRRKHGKIFIKINTFEIKNLHFLSFKLQIVTDCGSHGTHVAGITSAYFENNKDLNGVAPGAKIVGIKIGDNRLNGMETNYALVNAVS